MNILLICICLPKRRQHMQKQLDHFNIEVLFFDAVQSLDDPRVASMITKKDTGDSYLCTLSHHLCMEIASRREHATIIMEDDVILHKDFVKSVTDLTAMPQFNCWGCVSLGYLLQPGDNMFNLISDRVSIGSRAVGKSLRDYIFGTQCYVVSPAYAEQIMTRVRNLYINTEQAVFHENRYVIVQPIAIEDFPTFGSTLGHSNNIGYYRLTTRYLNKNDFFKF